MKAWFRILAAAALLSGARAAGDSMRLMSGPNRLANGRFEKQGEVVMPWTGVDRYGYLRKSVQMRGVNIHVDRSNQFDYGFMANSASFVDINGDGLPDIIAPDGAGIFWCWRNIGTRENPQFGFGEVMPLLVDNERSRFRTLPDLPGGGNELTDRQKEQKKEIDAEREEALARLNRENEDRPATEKWAEEDLLDLVRERYPYPWELSGHLPGTTVATVNGYRQLRAVAAPCFWDRNDTVDFLVGDAQGNVYVARNTGTRAAPNFRTYRKSTDTLTLKLALDYNPLTRKNEYRNVSFLNYAAPFVTDWNGDGKPDLLLGEGTYSTNAVRLYLDPAGADPLRGVFPEERVLYVGEERTFLAPSAWDWDGDGHPDLIVADGEGRITIHPNPGGKYRHGRWEMTDFHTVEIEDADRFLMEFIVPQPCDWNADGIMDLIWSEPFGRILYALGKEKGGTRFAPPTPVKSVRAGDVVRYNIPHEVGMAAVPAWRESRDGKGGTSDSRRYYTASRRGGHVNTGGWPKQNPWYGLMPAWDPDVQLERLREILDRGAFNDERFYRTGPVPSYAVAPVPYELFGLVPEANKPGNGEGAYTLRQTWHDPRRNALFTQPRDAMTPFGQAVSLLFERADIDPVYKKEDSRAKQEEWMRNNLHMGNVRVSFYLKLEGEFSRMTVHYLSRHWGREDRRIIDGGNIRFHTLHNPPTGRWIHYESVVGPSDFPRHPGALEIRIHGRGDVHIRDVAVADTHQPPTRR